MKRIKRIDCNTVVLNPSRACKTKDPRLAVVRGMISAIFRFDKRRMKLYRLLSTIDLILQCTNEGLPCKLAVFYEKRSKKLKLKKKISREVLG